mgnify:CR=1 FL=1
MSEKIKILLVYKIFLIFFVVYKIKVSVVSKKRKTKKKIFKILNIFLQLYDNLFKKEEFLYDKVLLA